MKARVMKSMKNMADMRHTRTGGSLREERGRAAEYREKYVTDQQDRDDLNKTVHSKNSHAIQPKPDWNYIRQGRIKHSWQG